MGSLHRKLRTYSSSPIFCQLPIDWVSISSVPRVQLFTHAQKVPTWRTDVKVSKTTSQKTPSIVARFGMESAGQVDYDPQRPGNVTACEIELKCWLRNSLLPFCWCQNSSGNRRPCYPNCDVGKSHYKSGAFLWWNKLLILQVELQGKL